MSFESGPSRVLKHLYIGSQNDAKSKALLQQLKITHILNCTPPKTIDPAAGCPNFFEKEGTFTYKRISIFDNAGEDILSFMASAIDFIERSKHYGAVLVHCKKGVSRSASFVLGYLMKVNEFTLEEALAYLQGRRSIVMPNETFMSQLKSFEKMLMSERLSEMVLHTNTDDAKKTVFQSGPMMPAQSSSSSISGEVSVLSSVFTVESRDKTDPVTTAMVVAALDTLVSENAPMLEQEHPHINKSIDLIQEIHVTDDDGLRATKRVRTE